MKLGQYVSVCLMAPQNLGLWLILLRIPTKKHTRDIS